jgi:hypothetical protein
MGFLNKLFGKEAEAEQSNEVKPQQNQAPCKTEQELIERFGGIGFEKQLDFGDVIGNNNWNIDIQKGEIGFGPDLVFPIQVLGSFSHGSETWLWAWANTQSNLPENILQQALHLKKYGEENGIDLLTSSEFDATINDMHLIGMIASGMFDTSGYYIADYGQGAMVVSIKSNALDKFRKNNHLRIATVFPQLISQFEMNHKAALSNYLSAKNYAVLDENLKLTGTKNGNTITAEFDELNRLTKLNG